MAFEGLRLGERKVLVVDDESNIVKVVTRILEAMGYSVFGAATVAKALEVLKDHGPVDCAVLDYSLEGTSCEEVYEAMISAQPGLRVLISSGYSEGEVTLGFPRAGECAGFLRKPFGLDSLVKAVTAAAT